MSKDKIEVSMNVYDIPIVIEALEKAEDEIMKLQQENQQLKKQKADVVECLKELSDNTDDTTCYEIDRNSRNDLLRMLGEI